MKRRLNLTYKNHSRVRHNFAAASNVTGRHRGPKHKHQAGYRPQSQKRMSCCDYFSSSSVVSCSNSVICLYSKIGHQPHSLGYLCAKFCFLCSLHCWASPWRKIAYSLNLSLTQLIWWPGNRSLCFGTESFKNTKAKFENSKHPLKLSELYSQHTSYHSKQTCVDSITDFAHDSSFTAFNCEQNRHTKSVGGANDIDLFSAIKPIKFSQQLVNNVHSVSTLPTPAPFNHILYEQTRPFKQPFYKFSRTSLKGPQQHLWWVLRVVFFRARTPFIMTHNCHSTKNTEAVTWCKNCKCPNPFRPSTLPSRKYIKKHQKLKIKIEQTLQQIGYQR